VLLLIILDGFGFSRQKLGNATLAASTINNQLAKRGGAMLAASGPAVGLPLGQAGNSEVGHLTIGAGRVVKQKLLTISEALESGVAELEAAILEFLKTNKRGVCHLMGLFSSGGVHSDMAHLLWAIKTLRAQSVKLKVHIFLDGRDVGYRDAEKLLESALNSRELLISDIATIQGRFYAMDRDCREERTQLAYDAIASGFAQARTDNPLNAIRSFYARGIYDETIPPITVGLYDGASKDDLFWMLNFRPDRIRQLLSKLLNSGYENIMTMTSCGPKIDDKVKILFPTKSIKNTLSEVLASHGMRQLRIAETEKYAHVTYFFNGGVEKQFEFEDRILVPSPPVEDYATTPAMSSDQIAWHVSEALRAASHQVIIVNFANADMLGHTGNLEATKESIRILDKHVENLLKIADQKNCEVIITADHGNADEMLTPDNAPHKSHTNALVPFVICSRIKYSYAKTGTLADIAPTILSLLDIPIPAEMTGSALAKKIA
jgi:2,3-bisphosphoglycerate-independent phosphoglycerate mutase